MKKKRTLIILAAILFAMLALVYAADLTEVTFRDGTGDNYYAQVNSDNQLVTRSVMVSALHDASLRGDAYSWAAATSNIDATDTAMLVVNQSYTRDLVIEKVYIWVDVPTDIDIHLPAAATWAGGTVVVGTNLNRNSTKTANAICRADETGNSQANLIATLHTNETTGDIHGLEWDLKGSVILGYDNAIAVDVVEEPAAYTCNIVGYFRDKE